MGAQVLLLFFFFLEGCVCVCMEGEMGDGTATLEGFI